jgi:hypothetical protein
MMKCRDIEYTVVQGIERGVWKWSASVTGVVIRDKAGMKCEALNAAETAIDREPASKKLTTRFAEDIVETVDRDPDTAI